LTGRRDRRNVDLLIVRKLTTLLTLRSFDHLLS
jgi:hypothetical protein